MPDYSKSQIYKLISDNGLVYVGATTVKLSQRLAKHKCDTTTTSRKLFENDSKVVIELIEKFPCNDIDELHKREGYWIRKIECVNKKIAGQTKKESSKEWNEKNPEYYKKYRDENREKILEKKKDYHGKNKGETLENIKNIVNKIERKFQKK